MTTNSIDPRSWLRCLESEYFDGFIPDGGASVKFAVPLDAGARSNVLAGLREAAERRGYLTLEAQADAVRVHMIDQLFFALARQVPWLTMARSVLSSLAKDAGFALPTRNDRAFSEAVAEANGIEDHTFVRIELQRRVANTVFRDRSLAKDFRVAMSHLCQAELSGGPEGETTVEVITAWLTGEVRTVGAVKPYSIRTRNNRTNARYLLESLLAWARSAGFTGTVVLLDTERLTVARNPKDGTVYYSKAAYLDAYELLRQFIDSTDRLQGCLLVVVPGPEFLDPDRTARGMGSYEALMFRVYDEVRDRELVNPMASLVRLSSEEA